MEVGLVRERIIVALLIYKFGESNVETEIPITEPEVDAKLFGEPVSIKTIKGKSFSGVKLIWTVDAQKQKNSVRTIITIAIFCLFKSTGMIPEVLITFF
jgi:hypothetical protein